MGKRQEHLHMERASTSEPVQVHCSSIVPLLLLLLLHLRQGEVIFRISVNSCHFINFYSIPLHIVRINSM